ncbi:hypothetical protein D0Z07_0524 [Hyphodiscus hymeniophilus]|uniref:Uncharacterized protein n=1 Tax=Hyphodiscus hymeniophilus TaxID=353542 RepID=A0A9P6VQA7_9HELO|nr:hypothetical protein D0Z07_0524 [Hyphodiscus hymeniophilus]
MGIWPFRRKSKRRQLRGGAENPRSEEIMHDAGTHNGADLSATGPERRRSRRDSQKKRKSSKDSKKLQRDPERRRTYSFSPGRNDNIRVPQDTIAPPVPRVPSKHKGKSARRDTEMQDPLSVDSQPIRANTQPPEYMTQDWQRVPTLHKRSAQDLPRRKSSKKRKEDHDREAEIKAMAAFMPTRPATESGDAGRPMKRESKKMRGGLNRDLQNPSSDISLPFAESLHSSLSSNSESQTSYTLSAFEALAPRPTIRYSTTPRYAPPERSTSKKRRVSERVSIPEETLKANKRIDDLADDLDASELRELMERDQKRKEKRKIAERIKIEKKLARQQEKQREGEAIAAREGRSPPPNMERGVLGRDVIGLGIGTSALVTSSKRKGSTGSETGRENRPAEAFRENSTTSAQNPFLRSASLASDQFTPSSEVSEPVVDVAQVGTVEKASISPAASPRGHARGASSISQLMELGSEDKTVSPAPAKKPEPIRQPFSESASRAPPQTWTSFFKRNKPKRASTPSSFSNTSRDSMQNGQGPQIGYTPMRSTSNIPKRTMSKFREDLPELPISPPDSRVQSPEADDVPPIRTDYPDKKTGKRASADDPRMRYDTPTSGYRSVDTVRRETPTSGHRSVEAPSPEPIAALSQSLASIDSEGSWLSGRKGGSKRGSSQIMSHPLHDSASSLQQRYNQYSESAEELGIAEDEYFSRLTPGPDDQHRIHRQSAANASSEDEDGGSMGASPVPSEKTKWGAVGRHPTVVHRQPRAKSTEGLLNEFDVDYGSETPGETPPDIPNRRISYGFNKDLMKEDEVSLHRASSVDLGRHHARHISAGSARLLELRKSTDEKRISSG